jgi:aminoglycoside phosphotransferase (APT) family kinase protein
MARPWDPDHVPSATDLKATLRDQFPQVAWGTLRHLGSGWEFDAWITDDGWVFRFPRRARAVADLRHERPILELVAPVLAPEIAVPRPELWGEPGPHFPWHFAGYRFVEGVAVDHPRAPLHPELPAQLARALGRLHAVDPDEARRAGIPEDREGLSEWFDEIRERVREVAFVARLGLDAAPALPAPYEGPLRLVHNDLCPDHVLVDRATGAATGILDWTDAALADPTQDFIFLATWQGWDMVERVLDHYPLPLDPEFRFRLSGMARIRSLVWLQEAVVRQGDVEKHIQWVRNAFQGPGG